MVDWAYACNSHMNRPLWQLLQANEGGNLFAVRVSLCLSALLCLSAVRRLLMIAEVSH